MNNNLEYLLRRYAEGSLTPDEQKELNQLTHRDNIIQSATLRADKVCRQRRIGITSVASLLLVAGAFYLLPSHQSSIVEGSPIVAQADIPAVKAATAEQLPAIMPAEQPQAQAQPAQIRNAMPAAATQQEPTISEPAAVESPAVNVADEIAPDIHLGDAPMVACNTQCSPEDVIDDIWKFLKA